MSSRRVRNARLCEPLATEPREVRDQGDRRYCVEFDSSGRICEITPESEPTLTDHDWDLGSDWLSPGGVDLQINGALGLAFPELQPKDLPKLSDIGRLLRSQGVVAYYPTIVTTSPQNVQRALAVLAAYRPQSDAPESTIAGVHLEGPFLAAGKRGAHPEQFLLPLQRDRLTDLWGTDAAAIAQVKIVTLAPELDPSGDVIAELRSRGIIVSLGHSQATAAEAEQAFDRGASMVTHAFNAMPPLHHRQPGLLGAAIVRNGVRCGLIADGQHVDPTMLKLLLRAARGTEGIFLVSDALAPLGLPDGIYPWDEREMTVRDGTARLADGTLAGTTLPLLAGVQNLVKWGLCDIAEAIALATVAPRRAMGQLAEGANPYWGERSSDLLRWRRDAERGLTWSWLVGDRS